MNPTNGVGPQNAGYNSFIQSQKANSYLNSLAGGKIKRMRKMRRGGQSVLASESSSVLTPASVLVPQPQILYNSIPPISGAGGIIAKLTSITNQNIANSEYDKYAGDNTSIGGGYRRRSTKKRKTNKRRTNKRRKSRKYK